MKTALIKSIFFIRKIVSADLQIGDARNISDLLDLAEKAYILEKELCKLVITPSNISRNLESINVKTFGEFLQKIVQVRKTIYKLY